MAAGRAVFRPLLAVLIYLVEALPKPRNAASSFVHTQQFAKIQLEAGFKTEEEFEKMSMSIIGTCPAVSLLVIRIEMRQKERKTLKEPCLDDYEDYEYAKCFYI
jgi:hypothetical protein